MLKSGNSRALPEMRVSERAWIDAEAAEIASTLGQRRRAREGQAAPSGTPPSVRPRQPGTSWISRSRPARNALLSVTGFHSDRRWAPAAVFHCLLLVRRYYFANHKPAVSLVIPHRVLEACVLNSLQNLQNSTIPCVSVPT